MDRRRYLESLGAVVAAGTIAGCAGNGGGTDDGNGDGDGGGTAYGTLATSVTDQPNDIADFESLVVTLEGLWVKPAGSDDEEDEEDGEDENGTPETDGNETDADAGGNVTDSEVETDTNVTDADGNETDIDGTETVTGDGDGGGESDDGEGSGRRYVEFEEPQEADLVQLQGGNAQLVDETELEVGEYQFLQLDVNGVTGTLVEGGEATVETPGNAPLQFKQSFEVREGETTRFVADFAPFRRGNGEYLIRPVATGTRVLYGDEEYEGGTDSEDDDEDEGTPEASGNGGGAAGGN